MIFSGRACNIYYLTFHLVDSSKIYIPTIKELGRNVPEVMKYVLDGVKCEYKKVLALI